MDAFSNNLITALGGSTAVAALISAPVTTVQSWKKNGIPRSRLAHLRLVAERERKTLDWETGRLVGCDSCSADHALVNARIPDDASSGNSAADTAQVAA